MISDPHALDNFKSLLNKDEHFFAPNLCNLLCDLKKNKELWHAINEKALAEENEDRAPLNAKEAQLLKTLKSDHKRVEQYCEKHNIEMPIGFMGVEGISEFRAYEQGKIVSSGHIVYSLIHAHNNVLSNLMKVGFNHTRVLGFIKKHVVIDPESEGIKLRDSSPDSIQKTFNEIILFVNQEQFLCPQLKQEFHNFANQNNVDLQRASLLFIFRILYQTDFNTAHHLDFVKQHVTVNEEGSIIALKISTLITEWDVEIQALARKQPGKFWHAWKQLTRFHDSYHDFEHLRIEALEKGELFEEWQLCEDVKKINNLNNSKGDLYKKELQFYVKQLLSALESLPRKTVNTPGGVSFKQSNPNQQKYITARINEDRVELFMCKKEELADQQEADISFKMRISKGRNRRCELLILLLRDTMGVRITMLHENLSLTNNKQLDKAISGINETFRLKTNFRADDLIVRKKSRIIINDKYTVELI
jgi:hypothetical protein